MSSSSTREERFALLASINAGATKYAAKLSFDQRCEILALRHAGVRREVLAKMYGVDRRTITHIYNPLSPHYKNVRATEVGMGKEKFRETFVTDELLADALARSEPEAKNNKFASKKAGLHVVRGTNCNYDHRVRIEWLEAGQHDVEEAGWYYCDLDSDFPTGWFTAGGPDSLKNSQSCFAAMLHDITDKFA